MPSPLTFLLVESRAPAAGSIHGSLLEVALSLREDGHPVRLLLIQDGVAAAALREAGELVAAGGELWADEFSLRQRGLTGMPPPAVRRVGMDEVAACVQDPDVRVVWR